MKRHEFCRSPFKAGTQWYSINQGHAKTYKSLSLTNKYSSAQLGHCKLCIAVTRGIKNGGNLPIKMIACRKTKYILLTFDLFHPRYGGVKRACRKPFKEKSRTKFGIKHSEDKAYICILPTIWSRKRWDLLSYTCNHTEFTEFQSLD
jgi:hypothetical protein